MIDSGSTKISADGQELLKTLAEELGKLPNMLATEGRTDSKPFAAGSNYGNWELSSDRANVPRRLTQQDSIREDQVTQVRGFADQRLRKKDNPLDPAKRRISLIVQYLIKPEPASGGTGKDGEKAEKSAEKSAKKPRNSGRKEIRYVRNNAAGEHGSDNGRIRTRKCGKETRLTHIIIPGGEVMRDLSFLHRRQERFLASLWM
jgi:OmpA family